MSEPLILASGSAIRVQLLRDAGVVVETKPVDIDEGAITAAMLAEDASGQDIADTLAELKAQKVAMKLKGGLVLGADQVLIQGRELFGKPASMEVAGDHLRKLRGKTHQLLSAAVIFEDGAPVWRHVGRAQMIMRPFSDEFLENYLAEQGEKILASVGCYMLEAGGAQLFSRIQGDYFSVLGLPLLEVLGFLRTRGICIE